MTNIQLLPALEKAVKSLNTGSLSAERRHVLQPLIDYICLKRAQGRAVNLNFICTHNSRRSQLSQVWAQIAAAYFGIGANCYSGGTEATAFNERAVASLQRAGFSITAEGQKNPRYTIRYSETLEPLIAFSKTYDDPANAQSDFAAIMNCSEADKNCPFIPGAEVRIPIRYEDPKAFDGTGEERLKYDERSLQIAAEMFYVFRNVR